MSDWSFSDLIEYLYSFETSQKLTTVTTGKNAVKSGCFKKSLRRRALGFSEIK